MDYKTVLIVIASVLINKSVQDIDIGEKGGPRLYEVDIVVPRSLWQRVKNITIATDEPISRVVITDLNANHVASAAIVNGGLGHKNVTIRFETSKNSTAYSYFVELYGLPNSTTTTAPPGSSNIEYVYPKEGKRSATEGTVNNIEIEYTKLKKPKTYKRKTAEGKRSNWSVNNNKKLNDGIVLLDETLHNKEIKPYYHIGREGESPLDFGGFNLRKNRAAKVRKLIRKEKVIKGQKGKDSKTKPKANNAREGCPMKSGKDKKKERVITAKARL